jgi:exportin-1
VVIFTALTTLQVLAAVFEPTLGMITVNFEDFPEHRLKFFGLLHAITNHCFACLFGMSPPQLKLLIDSIVWAFRHTERNVAETGLLLLEVSWARNWDCWLVHIGAMSHCQP